jgi:hypothetical protein
MINSYMVVENMLHGIAGLRNKQVRNGLATENRLKRTEMSIELINERLATEVMGWHGYIGTTWSPATEITDAWRVHKTACSWSYDEYVHYLRALRDMVIERVKTEGRMREDATIEWPHILASLEPIDICNAALKVRESIKSVV